MKRYILAGVMIAVASVFFYGCADYGSIKPTTLQEVTIETLVKNWMNYKVYMTGLDINEPTALIFVPKNDGRAIISDRFYNVVSEESLLKMVVWLKTNDLYYPYVWRAVGPDGQFFGYVYTGYTHFILKMVDEKTMLLYGMPATLRGEDRGFPFFRD